MKKQLLITLTLITTAILLSFKANDNYKAERLYTINIPEHLIQPFYSLINSGSADNLTIGQMKEITQVINEQVQPQYIKYAKEDSATLSKQKRDTTNKK